MDVPEFVAVGHVVKDLAPGGWRLGGTVTYAAVQAQRLGLTAGVVTIAGTSVELDRLLPGVEVCRRDDGTTCFRNTYVDGQRRQEVPEQAEPLTLEDVPRTWRAAPIVLVGPVCGEAPPGLAAHMRAAIVGVSAQGWLREVDPAGHVRRVAWKGGEPFWRGAGALFVSDEDVEPDPSQIEMWVGEVPIVAVTRAHRGVSVHADGHWLEMDAFPEDDVDPTGAGDVFAAAFLVRYRETGSVAEATVFGSAAASLSVGGFGTEAIPTREQVEDRIERYPEVHPK